MTIIDPKLWLKYDWYVKIKKINDYSHSREKQNVCSNNALDGKTRLKWFYVSNPLLYSHSYNKNILQYYIYIIYYKNITKYYKNITKYITRILQNITRILQEYITSKHEKQTTSTAVWGNEEPLKYNGRNEVRIKASKMSKKHYFFSKNITIFMTLLGIKSQLWTAI